MSNLSVYSGNFVSFADNEFAFAGSNREIFAGIDAIDLNVSCHVGIFPSESNEVSIEIDAEDPSDFSVSRDGSVLIVKERSTGGSNVINANGVTIVSGGGNVSMINGRIFIDGREVDPDQPQGKSKRRSRIRIFAPHQIDLNASLNGLSVIASKTVFRKASVKVSGNSTVGLAAKTVKLKISGQGESFIVLKGGDLNVSVSGQGSVRVKGDYESADLSVSGMGGIQTEGICNGDYDASVSGMGAIVNSGIIHGRKHKSVTGMGRISI